MKRRLCYLKKINANNIIAKKLINGIVWSILGTILSKVFIMVASIITTRILGADKNGEYSVVNSTVLMFSTFAGLGLGTTATRFISEYKATNKIKCGRIITMTYIVSLLSGCIMATILIVLSPWLAYTILNVPHLDFPLRLSSILLITNTINVVQQSILSGFERFKDIAKVSIIQGILSLPVFVVLTYFMNLNGLILGHIIITLITSVLFTILINKIRKEYKIQLILKGVTKELDVLWKFSLPSMLSSAMVGPIIWIGNTFIASIPNGYYELGIYNAANQWRAMLTFIPSAIGNVLLPLIISNKKIDRLERINILFGWIVVLSISIPLLAIPELLSYLYGSEYYGSSFNLSFLIIILISCILSYKEGIARNLVSNNLMWWGFLDNSLWGGTFLVILWLIRSYGAIAISVSNLLAYIFSTIVFVPFYIKKGVVHRSLIISKDVVFMWCTLLFQLICSMLTSNFIIRIITLAISYYSLIGIIKTMLKNEKFE